MKRFILVATLIIFSFPIASAQVMYQLNVTVDVKEDAPSDIKILFQLSEGVDEINFPLSGEITDLKTTNEECILKKEEVKSFIHCEPTSEFLVGRININTGFKQAGLIQRYGNISQFSFDIPITMITDHIFITVKLPSGAIIAEKIILPISPSEVEIGSDGRRIITKWSIYDKIPGDVIPVRLYFESSSTEPIERVIYLRYRWLIAIIIIMSVSFVIIYKKFSKKSKLVLSVLNEGERMIVDIIRKEGKDKIDQRKIVSLSGFSKAKVTRTIQSLVARGVVETERVGRKNKVSLKKIIKE